MNIPPNVLRAAKIADAGARMFREDGIAAAAKVIAEWARNEALREAIEDIQRLPNSGPSVSHLRALADRGVE